MISAVEVTVLLFLAGIIFAAGRVTARVDELERWRRELKDDIGIIRTSVARIDVVLAHDPRVNNP